MVALIAIFILLFLALALVAAFMRADASKLAGSLKLLGPLLPALAGLALCAGGLVGAGALLIATSAAWYGLMATRRRRPEPPRKRSLVRTAALEMELDHDSGGLEGLVLAGRQEGKVLGSLSLAELKKLLRELSSDPESQRLLHAYLDSRFPVWRTHAEADAGKGLGIAPGSGPMTKEEAYKILGLEAGAAAADIRKAHRRLMQRLNSEVGGASLLAARINEAKDVLLSDHN